MKLDTVGYVLMVIGGFFTFASADTTMDGLILGALGWVACTLHDELHKDE